MLTDLGERGVADLRARVEAGELHPKGVKSDLARRIVAELHSPAAADEAAAEFDRVHSRGELPSDLRDVSVEFGSEAARPLARVLVEVGLAASASDAVEESSKAACA